MKQSHQKSTVWVLVIFCASFFSFKASMYFLSGLDAIEPIGQFVNGNLPTIAPQDDIVITEIHTALDWESPQAALPFPGTNKLLVVEMDGRFFLLDDNDNATDRTLVMDIQDRCWYYDWFGPGTKHGGFQNAVFHPNFGEGVGKDYIYVYYLYNPINEVTNNQAPYYNRLSRFEWTGNTFDPDSELIMINQYDTANGHDGGGLAFGSDGFLYITVGDEGTQNAAATQHSQTINDRFRSGVWRIDVDQQGGAISHPIDRQLNNANVPQGSTPSYTQGYYIPNDNPWVTGNGQNLEEFYAIGLRSPFRMSYDELSGGFWIGDVGSSSYEEVDFMDRPGLNFEWNYKEGNEFTGYSQPPANIIGEERGPIYAYGRNEGRAVIGGYVYRGNAIPSLYGKYIFGDNGNGQVFALTPNSTNTDADVEVIGNIGGSVFNGISSLGYTHDNEILVLRLSSGTPGNGKIFKISASPTSGSISLPNLLSETGVFSDMQNLVPSPGVIPYNVNTPLWSDGTEKFRWVALPQDGNVNTDTERIGYSEEGQWTFPVGTVFIKHFQHPNGTKLETRLWIHGDDGQWFGSSYKWRANGLEADLLLGGATENLVIDGENFSYTYPNTTQCIQCHNQAAGGVLGFNTRQLNRDIVYPTTGRTANQLETLHTLGFIPNVDTDNVLTSAAIDDHTKSLEYRARSYFDANCAYCHLPGNTRANFDMRLPINLSEQNLVNGAIIEDLNIDGAVAIAPGAIEKSIAYLRTQSVNPQTMMPPMAKGRTDKEAVQLLEAWIEGLGIDCQPEEATTIVMGNSPLSDGNFIDAHSPHVNINRTDGYTNTTNEDIALCINDFKFYARRLGNPITPFIAKVNGENDFTIISIGQSRLSTSYSVGENTFSYSDISNDGIVLKPGESIAPGFIDAFPDGSASVAGSSVIPAITGTGQDDVWQSYELNNTESPAIVMGSLPKGNTIAQHLARSYQFSISMTSGAVPDTNTTTVVSLYQHINFQGESVALAEGNYPNLSFVGFSNNDASSVQIQAGYKVQLFSEENFSGSFIELTADNSDFRQNNFNDLAASVKVISLEDGDSNENLALNKPAEQSTIVYAGVASRAVDGNRLGSWADGFITHTDLEVNPWWRVDLGSVYNINEIRVYNRTDCCTDRLTNAKVYVGNVPSTNPMDYQEVATLNSNYEQVLSGLSSVTGRYVMIQHSGNAIISLAEVEVYGTEGEFIPVTGVTLSPDSLDLAEGATANVTATVSPSNASNTSITWLSSNNSIATVNENGLVTAVEEGTTTITATTNDGNFEASTTVTVTSLAASLFQHYNFEGASVALTEGDYPNFSVLGFADNSASSVQIQSGYKVELFTEENFAGTSVVLTATNDNFGVISFNDLTSSVKVSRLEDGDINENLALNKPAEQSTIVYAGVASRAVDGNRLGSWADGFITHTDLEINPWWRVDLGSVYNINEIRVYNRTDCCTDRLTNATVYVGNTPSTNPADYQEVATLNSTYEQVLSGLSSVTGRYVMIQHSGNAIISLAEVEVYGTEGEFIPVTGVTLSPDSLDLAEGATANVAATVSPSNASNTSLTWLSSNNGIATVNENGLVTAVAEGTTTITATTNDGDFVASTTVTVTSLAASLFQHYNFEGASVALTEGDYPNFSALGFADNSASSVQIQSGYKVELFTEENFAGTSVVLTATNDNFGVISFNDLTSSVKVSRLEDGDSNENLALNKPALQSSTVYAGVASRAVDGNRLGNWREGFITHTDLEVNPWWRVDLGSVYNINEIRVYNRTDCCTDRLTNATVYVGNTPSTNPADYQEVATLNSTYEQVLTGLSSVTGRYVMIRHSGNAIISLAEVEVYGSQTDIEPEECQCMSGEASLLTNGSFEETSNPAYSSAFELIEALGSDFNGVKFIDFHPDTDFPGWFTTGGIALQQGGFSQGETIELGHSGFLGVFAADGNVFAEMDGNQHNQIISVQPGQLLDWELSHRGRNGVDTITVYIGPIGNQTEVAELSSSNTAWVTHVGQYQVPDGVTEIQFSIAPSGASDGDIDSSNLLDNVKLCPSNTALRTNHSKSLNNASVLKDTTILYPNPTDGVFILKRNHLLTEPLTIFIYDGFGKLIKQFAFSKEFTSKQVDISAFQSGKYMVIIKGKSGYTETHKILKR